MLISKQSLWSRQRCCYYYHHRPPSPDFNQVLNTSIVAPGRGSSRLLFFLPLSNRIEPRLLYECFGPCATLFPADWLNSLRSGEEEEILGAHEGRQVRHGDR